MVAMSISLLPGLNISTATNIIWVHNSPERTSGACLPLQIGNFNRFPRPSASAPLLFVSSSLSDMDASGGLSLYPSHRCKTIHMVRHAQGIHNVEGEKDHSAYMSPDLFDAQLTPLGWEQVDNLRKHVHSTGLHKKIELVVASPLLRTMQTAVGVFGGEGYTNGVDAPPLMVAGAGNSSRPAISSLNCPPFMAVELCREHLGVHWCDKRRSVSEYKSIFPAIDFSTVESDADVLWTVDVREANKDVAARGMKFLKWLWTREEKEIAVVTHSGFLIHTLSAFGGDCHPSIRSEICKGQNEVEISAKMISKVDQLCCLILPSVQRPTNDVKTLGIDDEDGDTCAFLSPRLKSHYK